MQVLLVAQLLCLMANALVVPRPTARVESALGSVSSPCVTRFWQSPYFVSTLSIAHHPDQRFQAVRLYCLPCRFQDQRPDQELGFLHTRPWHEVGKLIARRDG